MGGAVWRNEDRGRKRGMRGERRGERGLREEMGGGAWEEMGEGGGPRRGGRYNLGS